MTDYQRPFPEHPALALRREDVLAALTAIWSEYERRKGSRFVEKQAFGLSKNESAKSFLSREIYALGLALRHRPPKWNLAEYISSIRSAPTSRIDAIKDHTFKALLLGVYESDTALSRQERFTMSEELEYAASHGIDPQLLCGFLYQSGGRKNLSRKLKEGYIEPAFQDHSSED